MSSIHSIAPTCALPDTNKAIIPITRPAINPPTLLPIIKPITPQAIESKIINNIAPFLNQVIAIRSKNTIPPHMYAPIEIYSDMFSDKSTNVSNPFDVSAGIKDNPFNVLSLTF